MDSEIIMSVKDLQFTYEDGTKALININLDIRRGEKLAIMGPNGSGKSTLFLCLNGVHKIQKGEIIFNGEKIGYSKKKLLSLRNKVGIVFQEPDNQLFCADIYGEISFGPLNMGYSKDVVKKKVEAVMEQLDIEAFQDKPIHFLSGGQKKQVSVADIVVMEPDIIILDEPCAALDPVHTKIVNDIMEELNEKGMTVIFSTHNGDQALEYADRILILNKGKVEAIDNPITIFQDMDLLNRTNLERPTVLRIYDCLVRNKIMSEKQIPRNAEELIKLVETHIV